MSTNRRQEVETAADAIADAIGVDPEDVAIEPGAGVVTLSVAQARALLDACKPQPPAGQVRAVRFVTWLASFDNPARYQQVPDLGEIIQRAAEIAEDLGGGR